MGEEGKDEFALAFAEFLETHPPGSAKELAGITRPVNKAMRIDAPELQLHCSSEWCRGSRLFYSNSWAQPNEGREEFSFFEYSCRNCERSPKSFALRFELLPDNRTLVAKVGEWPSFGPPVPSRVISMIGAERDLFLKGRRAENMGLGVGAFAYYRRVIEGQWQRLIAEVTRVAVAISAPTAVIATLRRAENETQFKSAVDMIKEAVPDTLRIGGHNPITLLYSALSEGLHAESDEECLELAQSVRVVLTELAERMGQALKDERELQEALTRLINRKT